MRAWPVWPLRECIINAWQPIATMPAGQVENEMRLVRRKHVQAPIGVFWIKGRWVYPPHWDDYPGEEATHWKKLSKAGAGIKRVDVAISAYGKPYQTAVTLASLLRHCERHIDTIYFHL